MKEKNPKMHLAKLDDLFTSQAQRDYNNAEKVEEIDINLIDEFPNHPFKVKNDEQMEDMKNSIIENGVMIPAIVRKKEDGRYEMVSGHRRRLACKLAKIEKLPCIVKDLTDEEATILMVDTNIQQRDIILPSEKAFAYKVKMEALKKQGKRNDLTSGQVGTKLRTDEFIAQTSEDSARQIQRYIRLTYLIPELLELVDNQVLNNSEKQKIALLPAVELSYLKEDEQTDLLDAMDYNKATPSHAQARLLRSKSEKGELDFDVINTILEQEKPNQKEQLKFNTEKIRTYFPSNFTLQKMEDVIIKLLEGYKSKWQNRER